jgi:DUF4097 and DUF4098 domain-containing protein YvlB
MLRKTVFSFQFSVSGFQLLAPTTGNWKLKTENCFLRFFVVFIFIVTLIPASALTAVGQTFSKTFTVSPESSGLEVINQIGSIKVSTSGAHKIVISARQADSRSQIIAAQTQEGGVKVEVKGHGNVDFDITVPPSTRLDLFTYKGAISVADLSGPVLARITTSGNIQFTGLRSPKVEAHSLSGNVMFDGELLPDGEYKLKSFSGRVEANFPPNADFRLSASSFSGVMDLGGFPMKFYRQTNQLVEATCGRGLAKVFLWTQDGSIYLRRKQ